jgi:hypothetical protein
MNGSKQPKKQSARETQMPSSHESEFLLRWPFWEKLLLLQWTKGSWFWKKKNDTRKGATAKGLSASKSIASASKEEHLVGRIVSAQIA